MESVKVGVAFSTTRRGGFTKSIITADAVTAMVQRGDSILGWTARRAGRDIVWDWLAQTHVWETFDSGFKVVYPRPNSDRWAGLALGLSQRMARTDVEPTSSVVLPAGLIGYDREPRLSVSPAMSAMIPDGLTGDALAETRRDAWYSVLLRPETEKNPTDQWLLPSAWADPKAGGRLYLDFGPLLGAYINNPASVRKPWKARDRMLQQLAINPRQPEAEIQRLLHEVASGEKGVEGLIAACRSVLAARHGLYSDENLLQHLEDPGHRLTPDAPFDEQKEAIRRDMRASIQDLLSEEDLVKAMRSPHQAAWASQACMMQVVEVAEDAKEVGGLHGSLAIVSLERKKEKACKS